MPASDIAVKTGINSDYFMQIAKLRAIRRLWQSFKEELDLRNNIYLVVETSLTNKSLSDRYNNLLRTTMEAMGAVAGGCNELIISEFDRLNPSGDGLSERMAVNQQHILKNESYLDKMADVSCGSYYIESLTDAIAHKALEHFKRFERAGGYFECQRNGIIAAEIAEQAADRNNEFLQMKRLSIGVNKFRNEKEKITLSPDKINELKQLAINNPALQYELQHFFI
jgi:methylmalonyl-CoA mutase